MKIFISVTQPMSQDLIKEIECFATANSPFNYMGKVKYYDWEKDNQTAYIDLPENYNPDLCEASHFVLAVQDFGDLQCFNGEPVFENGQWVNAL